MASIQTNPVPSFPGLLIDEVETVAYGKCLLLLIPVDKPDEELEETATGKSMVLAQTLKKDGSPGITFFNNEVKDSQGRTVALNLFATRGKVPYQPRPKQQKNYGYPPR